MYAASHSVKHNNGTDDKFSTDTLWWDVPKASAYVRTSHNTCEN